MTHSSLIRMRRGPAARGNVDEAGAVAALVALADDRIVAAEVRLDRRVGPAPRQELELVFDRRAVADEHQSALLLQRAVGDGRFTPTIGGPNGNAAPEDHPQHAVVRLAEIGGDVARVALADVREVRADRAEHVRPRLRRSDRRRSPGSAAASTAACRRRR